MALTFGSLFAGIGGLDLGLECAGMECKWQVEIDDYATRVLAKHWPTVRRWDDIKTFPPDTSAIRRNARGTEQPLQGSREPSETSNWGVDLICGGFPCQDISYAGRGAGLAGERSGLFFDAIRVVRQLKPRYVLLENVAALLTRGLDRVHGELATLGYDSESHCIPAAAVGAPHIRDRVFVLGHYVGDDSDTSGPGEVEARAARLPVDASQQGSLADPPREFGNDCDRGRIVKGRFPPGGCGSVDGGAWATEPDVGRVANGIPRRVERLKGLGNAVVPQVAEFIGKRIVEHSERGTEC